jgi:uncharacterized protein YlxW (UPF0749 family)
VKSRAARIRRPFTRARDRLRRTHRPPRQVAMTVLVCGLAGFMIVSSAIAARGTDLRAGRNTDLIDLVTSQAERNQQQARELAQERAEVDRLGRSKGSDSTLESQVQTASGQAGLTAVKGPAVSVSLTDAPADVNPEGVDQDLLVVHQQDIQAVVNALWRGGAEAMTIQGVRVISTTGVKCVGNTIVLHGVPYAPPYRIVAIGDQTRLAAALANSREIQIYQEYVRAYRLGYQQEALAEVTMPAFEGAIDNQYAHR